MGQRSGLPGPDTGSALPKPWATSLSGAVTQPDRRVSSPSIVPGASSGSRGARAASCSLWTAVTHALRWAPGLCCVRGHRAPSSTTAFSVTNCNVRGGGVVNYKNTNGELSGIIETKSAQKFLVGVAPANCSSRGRRALGHPDPPSPLQHPSLSRAWVICPFPPWPSPSGARPASLHPPLAPAPPCRPRLPSAATALSPATGPAAHLASFLPTGFALRRSASPLPSSPAAAGHACTWCRPVGAAGQGCR